MGNSNKKQARSVSNPILEGSQQKGSNQIDLKQLTGQTPKVSQQQQESKETPQHIQDPLPNAIQKTDNSLRASRDKRVSSEYQSDQRNRNVRKSGDVRKSYDSPSNQMKTCSNFGGGGGKKRKSLEDIMINEIQKLKKYKPPKNLQHNQIQSLQNYKQRLLTNANYNSSSNGSHIKPNQSSLLMNHLISHSRSISPSQNRLKSNSPESTIINKSGVFVPLGAHNINVDYKFEGLEEFSQFKRKQFHNKKRDKNYQANSPLIRSQTNPKKRQNWELIGKQTSTNSRNNHFSTMNNFNNTSYSSNSKSNKNNGLIKLISPEINPQNSGSKDISQSQNIGLPQLQASQQKSSYKGSPTQQKKYSPRRIEELFSIYEGQKRKTSNERGKEKQNYLKQISDILEKKYQNSSKKKLELEKVEPYVRAKSQNSQTPRQPSQSKRKNDVNIPMFIVNSPDQQEEDDFEKYCKPDTQRNQLRSSYQSTSSTNNPLIQQNRLLRYQLNPINYISQRSNSNGHKEPLQNLSKLRYYKPYQIEFDQQQYDILNKSNLNSSNNGHVKFNEYLRETQDPYNNTLYSRNQSFYEDPNNQSKISNQPQQQTGAQMLTKNNESPQITTQVHSEIKQSETQQYDKQIFQNQMLEQQINQNQASSPVERGQDRDPLSASFMYSTKNNFGNQSFMGNDSQYGFSESNSNHLNTGMKIRKYQNNSQIGVVSNQDIYKIYMKNPLLDVYTSTLKQNQKPQQLQKVNMSVLNQTANSTNCQFIANNSNNSNVIQESREFQKQKLIKTYQPRKLKYTKSQI